MNPQKTYLNFRNNLFLLIKNVPSKNILTILISRLILDGVAGFKFLLSGKFSHFFAILKAHFSFYRGLNRFIKKRKKNTKQGKYYIIFSVVWQYFILKRRYFNQL